MSRVLTDLIKEKSENLKICTVLIVDSDDRVKVRIQGNNSVWVSCTINVNIGDSVLIYNGTTKFVLQKLSKNSTTQAILLNI